MFRQKLHGLCTLLESIGTKVRGSTPACTSWSQSALSSRKGRRGSPTGRRTRKAIQRRWSSSGLMLASRSVRSGIAFGCTCKVKHQKWKRFYHNATASSYHIYYIMIVIVILQMQVFYTNARQCRSCCVDCLCQVNFASVQVSLILYISIQIDNCETHLTEITGVVLSENNPPSSKAT